MPFVVIRDDGSVKRAYNNTAADIVDFTLEMLRDEDDPTYEKRLEHARKLLAEGEGAPWAS
jgi:hypothetical protein